VPFHVEIRRGYRHARVFNLDRATLRSSILDPWVRAARPIELGGHEWLPRDCEMKILEGRELSGSDLAMGRGWDSAERTAENVTRALVQQAAAPPAPTVAVLAETPELRDEVERLLTPLASSSSPGESCAPG